MRKLAGSRPLVTTGLACAAAVLAVLFMARQVREALSPRGLPSVMPANASPPKAVPRRAEGPPMQIAPEELARAGRERDDNGLGMSFRWCPPGSFHMGRIPDRLGRVVEASTTQAILPRGFWMGKFEVTQSQWKSVMGLTLREQAATDPDQPRPHSDGTTRDHVGEGPDYPIYWTSHAEAEEFCRKLTETERATGRLEAGWEYWLPTEVQWEFACRAGTTTATAFGDRLSSTQANFDGTMPFNGAPAGPYLHETTPVGRYPANAWGLHDMHGNVWEWCRQEIVGTFGGINDPAKKGMSSPQPYRGGCWHNPGDLCLSTSRAWGERNGRGSGRGFRVALVPIGP